MDTRTIELNLKKLRSHQTAKPFKFLFPHKNVQKESNQLVSALAHEVRNPLATINLAVQILKSPNRVLDHKVYLDIILKASGQINDLITDLLTSWQPGERQLEKCTIHQLLDEALAMTEDRILLKNITVRKDYSALDCKILVNKEKIKIALVNIIINAIDAIHSQNGKLKLITRSINGKCTIEIEDKPGGMGLGLSTTMNILQANHATVDVQSGEGKGTRFILCFEGIQQSGE